MISISFTLRLDIRHICRLPWRVCVCWSCSYPCRDWKQPLHRQCLTRSPKRPSRSSWSHGVYTWAMFTT